jgi:acetyl-CoA carboxylase biotin carboxyl carrier protein
VLDPLSEEDVRRITLLVETLDRSSLDFIRLELGPLILTIGKGEPPDESGGAAMAPPEAAASPEAAAPPASPSTAAAAPAAAPDAALDQASVAIRAPIMGRFYAKPDPGAAPFVTVGTAVDEDTTVALIEVMKVFNAVAAGVRGIITEVCVRDAEVVEYGQVMFRVRTAGA